MILLTASMLKCILNNVFHCRYLRGNVVIEPSQIGHWNLCWNYLGLLKQKNISLYKISIYLTNVLYPNCLCHFGAPRSISSDQHKSMPIECDQKRHHTLRDHCSWSNRPSESPKVCFIGYHWFGTLLEWCTHTYREHLYFEHETTHVWYYWQIPGRRDQCLRRTLFVGTNEGCHMLIVAQLCHKSEKVLLYVYQYMHTYFQTYRIDCGRNSECRPVLNGTNRSLLPGRRSTSLFTSCIANGNAPITTFWWSVKFIFGYMLDFLLSSFQLSF